MTDRSLHPDQFEEALAASLERYAADVDVSGDAYAIADAMLEVRRRRRFRIGLGAIAGAVATAVLAGIAIGALAEPPPRVGPAPTESPRATESLQPTPSPEPTPEVLPGVEAPEACGFPPGTPLSYAGRSTTAELDVQEVVGDPLSFEPADIYITSEKQEQANGRRGRLVCAIFVSSDFVEVTMHPEDGGRFSPTPESSVFDVTCAPSPTPAPRSGDEPHPVTAAELLEADQCRDALVRYGGADLTFVAYPSGLNGVVSPCPPLAPSWFQTCAVDAVVFLRPQAPDASQFEYQMTPGVSAVIHPDLGALPDIRDELVLEPGATTLMRFTAHFDDPAASECRYAEWNEGLGPSPSPSEVVEGCRNTLVITGFEPVEP